MYILIGIALVFTIPILAMIFKGYSGTGFKVRAFSIDENLRHHEVQISQPYLGPSSDGPRLSELSDVAERIAISMSGYDKKLPVITMEEIRSLPPVYPDDK